jgi:hypothetical protein
VEGEFDGVVGAVGGADVGGFAGFGAASVPGFTTKLAISSATKKAATAARVTKGLRCVMRRPLVSR